MKTDVASKVFEAQWPYLGMEHHFMSFPGNFSVTRVTVLVNKTAALGM